MAEYFDIVDEAGQPTGEIISRDEAHQKGTLHRTAHVWLVKKKPTGYDILLQKRSEEKDSFPGMYDTSLCVVFQKLFINQGYRLFILNLAVKPQLRYLLLNPALAGGFFATKSPGKPHFLNILQ